MQIKMDSNDRCPGCDLCAMNLVLTFGRGVTLQQVGLWYEHNGTQYLQSKASAARLQCGHCGYRVKVK